MTGAPVSEHGFHETNSVSNFHHFDSGIVEDTQRTLNDELMGNDYIIRTRCKSGYKRNGNRCRQDFALE